MQQATPSDQAEFLMASDVARECEVSRGAVLDWDRRGILRAAIRTVNGTRLFRRVDVERIKRHREEVKRRD
jgi:DNA-binding transcriptional MerR regulator